MTPRERLEDAVDVSGIARRQDGAPVFGSGEARRMVQQHPHRDVRGLGRLHRKAARVVREGQVEGDEPAVDEDHRGCRRDHLARRSDAEHRLWRRSLSRLCVDRAERLRPLHDPVFDERDRDGRRRIRLEQLLRIRRGLLHREGRVSAEPAAPGAKKENGKDQHEGHSFRQVPFQVHSNHSSSG